MNLAKGVQSKERKVKREKGKIRKNNEQKGSGIKRSKEERTVEVQRRRRVAGWRRK